jgi:trk system potassium uptake protein TrkH
MAFLLPSTFSLAETIRYAVFQVVSAQSSTGFSIGNYSLWSFSSQILMLVLMFIGGMSGSTSGGIKVARYNILSRTVADKIESVFRPESVRVLKIAGREIPEKTSLTVLIFFCILIAATIVGTFLLILDHVDPETALSVISAMINNAGLTFGAAGPTESCAFLSTPSKLICILWMLLGRLELFALLVLLVPAFWKGK